VKRTLMLLMVAALMVAMMMMGTPSAFAQELPEVPIKKGKVSICHNTTGNNPHTIEVSENALPAHLAHGDAPVPCPEGPPEL
jgi:hypothetical protein